LQLDLFINQNFSTYYTKCVIHIRDRYFLLNVINFSWKGRFVKFIFVPVKLVNIAWSGFLNVLLKGDLKTKINNQYFKNIFVFVNLITNLKSGMASYNLQTDSFGFDDMVSFFRNLLDYSFHFLHMFSYPLLVFLEERSNHVLVDHIWAVEFRWWEAPTKEHNLIQNKRNLWVNILHEARHDPKDILAFQPNIIRILN